MKKLLVLLLTAALIAGLATCFAGAEAGAEAAEPAEPENLVADLGGPTEGMAMNLASSEESSAAAQFVITAPVLSISLCCPTWSRPNGGYLTMSLYAFDTDYAKTVAGTPLTYKRYDEFDDNQWLSLDFTAEAPLAPGEYIVMLSEPEVGQASGIWMDKSCDHQICWCDGLMDTGRSLRGKVTFVGQPETYFGTPTPPKPETEEQIERGDAPNTDFTVIFNDPDWDYIVAPQLGTAVEFDDDFLHITVAHGSDDPQVIFKFDDIAADPGVNVKTYPVLLMKVRRGDDNDPLKGEIFFFTENSPSAKSGNNFVFDYENTLDWQYVMINLYSNPRCRETFTGMRYDVFDHAPEGGTLDIAWITFFQSEEAAKQFDGDFSQYIKATEKPTSAPTAAPTATPEGSVVTAAPTADAAATGVPANNEPTAKPADNNSGLSTGAIVGIIAGGVIVLALAAVLVVNAAKKKKK